MKNTATIGIAALLAGAAGGYLAGKAGAPATDTESAAKAALETKTTRAGGSATASAEAAKRPRSVEDVMREPGQLARMQALMELYAGMDAAQLEAEAGKLDGMPMAQRLMASFLLFGRWGEVDPKGALAFANTMGFQGAFVRPTVLQSWASVDPENAAKYFSENPREFTTMGFGPGRGGPGGDSGASVIAAEWAKLDPEAALAWANGLTGRDKSAALNSVIAEMATKDPTKAAQVAATLTGDDQARAYSEIAAKWSSTDFAAAEAWIATLPAESRDRAMASALESLALTDPEGAAAKVASLPEGRDKDRAIEDIAGPWARKDPAAAAAWVSQQQTEDIDDAIRPVMSSWASTDPTAALKWIEALPQGELKDESTATYIWSNRTGDRASSVTLAETIEDEGTRNRTLWMTYDGWMREDREAATAAVQSSTTLSDEAKERLINNQGGRGRWGRGRGD